VTGPGGRRKVRWPRTYDCGHYLIGGHVVRRGTRWVCEPCADDDAWRETAGTLSGDDALAAEILIVMVAAMIDAEGKLW
jgi:hypothetical protein